MQKEERFALGKGISVTILIEYPDPEKTVIFSPHAHNPRKVGKEIAEFLLQNVSRDVLREMASSITTPEKRWWEFWK